jgi:hypothetical protein
MTTVRGRLISPFEVKVGSLASDAAGRAPLS